jgi:hypothetical protein
VSGCRYRRAPGWLSLELVTEEKGGVPCNLVVVFSALPPEREAVIAEEEIRIFFGVTLASTGRGPNVLVVTDAVSCLLAAAFDEVAKARVGNLKIRFIHHVYLDFK